MNYFFVFYQLFFIFICKTVRNLGKIARAVVRVKDIRGCIESAFVLEHLVLYRVLTCHNERHIG